MSWLKNKKSLLVGLISAVFLLGGFLMVAPALAQVNTGIEFGAYTGLVDTDIRIIVAKIIRVALGLLGIIILGYFLFGGYTYLTAGGDTDKTKTAKTIIKNAIIGLVIMLSAFSITQFIITRLTSAIIGNYCTENPAECADCLANPTNPKCLPPGCLDPSKCGIPSTSFFSSVAPQGQLPIYNVVINVQFSGAFGGVFVNRGTVNLDNIKIVKQLPSGTFETSSYPVTFSFVNDSLVSVHPVGSCGEGSTATDCFEKNTTYKVILSTAIKSTGGANLDCTTHSCEATFITGDKYDATPPTVSMVLPGNWAIVGDKIDTKTSANYSDDSGVKQVSFTYKSDTIVITNIADILINPFEATGSREFNLWKPSLLDSSKAEIGEVFATAHDLDNHQTNSVTQKVKIVPAYCFDGVVDATKKEQRAGNPALGIPDCGLGSECGACTGEYCNTNFDCAGSYCDLTKHLCVARPKILDIGPISAGVGSLVTIQGTNFGTEVGKVFFNGKEATIASCPLVNGNPASWSNNAVVVKVPTGSENGVIELRKTNYLDTADLANFDKTDDDWGFTLPFTLTSEVLPGISCVDPRSEVPGKPIWIAGENFGDNVNWGSLKFSDLLVSGYGISNWQNDEVMAFVPKMPAQTLSLKVVTTSNKSSNAVPFTIKPVAEDVLPYIEYTDPVKGSVGTYVTITGRNFGASGSVKFKDNPANPIGLVADIPACGVSWSPTQIIVKVPERIVLGSDSSRDYYIQVTNNSGDKSNSPKFVVNKDSLKPGLCKISPSSGPVGTTVTFNGEGFGSETNRGAVEYWSNVTSSFVGLVSPQAWSNGEIKDRVPSASKTGRVKIWSSSQKLYSNPLSFKIQNCNEEIKDGKKITEVCTGAGEKCCASGACGTTCPENIVLKSSVFAWSFSSGQFPKIPKVLEQCGNFCVGTSVICDPLKVNGSGSSIDCLSQTDWAAKNCQPVIPSPAPWSNKSSDVCVNAYVNVLFNTAVGNNGLSLSTSPKDTLFVYKCLDEACKLKDISQVLEGSYSFSTVLDDRIFFNPPKLSTSTTYQAVVTTNVRSLAGNLSANMPEDFDCATSSIETVFPGKKPAYCFKFKTSNTDTLCKVGSVVISPTSYTTSTLNVILPGFYKAVPLSSSNVCVGLDSSPFDWRWNKSDDTSKSNTSVSQFSSVSNKDANGDSRVDASNQDLTIKVKETSVPEIIKATWLDDPGTSVFDNKIKGLSYLTLTPQKPKLVDKFPNCNSACTNAKIGYRFSIPVKNAGSYQLLKCDNETCSNPVTLSNPFIYVNQENTPAGSFSKGVDIITSGNYPHLVKNTWYRVAITSYNLSGVPRGVQSASGAVLDEVLNYGNYAVSWMFRTKDDDTECGVDSVEMQPASATVNVIGATTEFYGLPKGKPDSCSKNGQILNGDKYNWSWRSDDTDVAVVSLLDRGPRATGSQSLIPFCGNGVADLSQNEECDSVTDSTCGIDCHKITSGSTKICSGGNNVSCCGNGGLPELGEQCDDGSLNGQPGSLCNSKCLKTATPISLNYCLAKNTTVSLTNDARKKDCLIKWSAIAVCGNGGTVEDGEECDLGRAVNGQPGSSCTDKCLNTANNFGTSGTNKCGNNNLETGNNEQCDGEIGCGVDCQWESKGNGLIDANQFAKARGLGTVNPTTRQQTTQIKATVQSKIGSADFILQCGYSPINSGCPNGDADKGAGSDTCCYPRPQVLDRDAINGGTGGEAIAALDTLPRIGYTSGICPNAKLSIRFNQVMDEASFASTTLGNYNIILAEDSGSTSCPSGTYKVAYQEAEPTTWWQKIKFSVFHFFGLPVKAYTYCAGGINYELATAVDLQTFGGFSVSSTVVSLLLKEPLEVSKNYKLLVTKDVSNIYNVKMENAWPMDFTTASQLCKINQLSVDPNVYAFTGSGDGKIFNTQNQEEKKFAAKPEFIQGSLSQELLKMPNIYDWNYSWVDGDGDFDIISVNPQTGTNQATVTALGKNGDTTLGANLTITEDKSAYSTVGKIFSATSTISVFLCQNPWPSGIPAPGLGLGYFDASGNTNGVSTQFYRTNFKLLYCRDAGDQSIYTDDFDALIAVPLIAQQGKILKEFLLTFPGSSKKDSIGLRVYTNYNHLTLKEWYDTQPWIVKGSPASVKVGSSDHVYDALQEGRTYYISGLNTTPAGSVFTNVYVFSFSDNPTSETLNIVTQLLNNFTLNVNEVGNKEKIAKIYRDYQRFWDLKIISQKLAENYKKTGSFPKLTENSSFGTFLPAYTNSKWQSWQVLGNALGFGMPNDPINQFYGCGNSTLKVGVAPNETNLGPFESQTCWNATNSTFVCPAGSRVYQYETSGGQAASVKADFEDNSNWGSPSFTDILNIKLCSLDKKICQSAADCYQQKCVDNKCELNGLACSIDANCSSQLCDIYVDFKLNNSCAGAVQGIGGKCGDGIVGPGEACEIGQIEYRDCTATGGYPGKEKWDCLHCGAFTKKSECVAQGKCSDGVKQANEQCDDGVNNGKYGFCNTTCTGLFSDYCGNLKFDTGKEVCDLSSTSHPSPAAYNVNKLNSCTWDCQSYDYCGDDKVNPAYETCETSESCQVGVCTSPAFLENIAGLELTGGKYCENSGQCNVLVSDGDSSIIAKPFCNNNKVCSTVWSRNETVLIPDLPPASGDVACVTNEDCQGSCINQVPGKKYCAATGEKKYVKFLKTTGWPYFLDATSTASIAPITDLTYSDSNKTCNWAGNNDLTHFATADVACLPTQVAEVPITQLNCGIDADKDGSYKDPGEECDFGPANGDICTPGAGVESCTFCDYGCKNKSVSSQFTLTTNVAFSGSGSGIPGSVILVPQRSFYLMKSQVEVGVSSYCGWGFEKWVGNVADSGTASTTIMINKNEIITAYFKDIGNTLPKKKLEFLASPLEGGIINSTHYSGFDYVSCATVTLTAVPNAGYYFEGWDGDITGEQNPISFTMSEKKNITAKFKPGVTGKYTLNINVNPVNAGITQENGQKYYNPNSFVYVTAEPNQGYEFVNWTGDETSEYSGFGFRIIKHTSLTANFKATTLGCSGQSNTDLNITSVDSEGGPLEIKWKVGWNGSVAGSLNQGNNYNFILQNRCPLSGKDYGTLSFIFDDTNTEEAQNFSLPCLKIKPVNLLPEDAGLSFGGVLQNNDDGSALLCWPAGQSSKGTDTAPNNIFTVKLK